MEPQSPKLSLDLSPPWLAGEQKKEPDKPSGSGLRLYVAQLEDELRKMEAFKRELPLSVLLLTDAIGRLKDEIPREGSENTDAVDGDKKNWMRSAQLWTSDQTSSVQLNPKRKRDREDDWQACKYAEKRGAISSFNEGSEISPAKEDVDRSKPVLNGTGLCSQVTSELNAGVKRGGGVQESGGARNTSVTVLTDQTRYQSSRPQVSSALQGQKKQRRSWSPELHRRFVDALEKLGGFQVATPKQIRELMQVNGLTNDEVKSHLQKYRLHIRKLPNPATSLSKDKLFASYDSQLEGNAGGVTTLKAEVSQSGSPQGPFQLAVRPAKCISAASRCVSMEDDNEEKSDSHSWEDHLRD